MLLFSGFQKETVTCTESCASSEEKNEVGPRGVFPLLHLTPNLTIFPSSFPPFSTVDRRNLAREALYPSFPSSVLGASGRTDGQRLLPPLPSAILSPRAARAALRRSLRDTDSFFPAAARELSPPSGVRRPSPLRRSSCGEGRVRRPKGGERDSSRLDIVVVVVVVRGGDELDCD